MRESEKNNKEEVVSKNRAPWQRPALRRLDANLAHGGGNAHDDGTGNSEGSGQGNSTHHS